METEGIPNRSPLRVCDGRLQVVTTNDGVGPTPKIQSIESLFAITPVRKRVCLSPSSPLVLFRSIMMARELRD